MTDCAVLINTWDKYSDAWSMMEHGLKKYWPDCPWPIYWMCNHKDPPMGIPIKTDNVTTWSFMMREALIKLMADGFDYFCFCHEDVFLIERVKQKMLEQYLEIMVEYKVDHIQLGASADVMHFNGSFAPDTRLLNTAPYSDYRTSNQPSLWLTFAYYKILQRMGDGRHSPWDFEVKGSKLSDDMLCLSTQRTVNTWPIVYAYRHVPGWHGEPIQRGRWTSVAIKYCEQEGIPYNFKEGDSVVQSS